MGPRLLLLCLVLAGCGARSSLGIADGQDGGGTCASSPTTPTVLASLGTSDLAGRPTAITIIGSSLYFSSNNGSNDPLAIDRLATTGGTPSLVISGVSGCATSPFGYGPVVTDGTYLYTPDEEMITTCTGLSLHVTSIDPTSGAATKVPNPEDGHNRGVSGLRASPARGLLWLAPLTFEDNSYPGTTLLAHWDGTATQVVGTIPGAAFAFVIAAGQAFVETMDTLYQLPLDGSGTAMPVRSVTPGFGLAGTSVESDAIFFTSDGSTILRRDVATGAEQTLATSGGGNFDGEGDRLWADDKWVYFVGGASDGLARVPVTGGAVEVLSPAEMRDGVNGIVTDACNVYWLADASFPQNLPPVVYAAAR